MYDYMRAVLKSEEVSERALDLTEKAARLNPANYTVWFYRRKLIRELQADLKKELLLLDDLIEMHPKNYQVWFHRQKVSYHDFGGYQRTPFQEIDTINEQTLNVQCCFNALFSSNFDHVRWLKNISKCVSGVCRL